MKRPLPLLLLTGALALGSFVGYQANERQNSPAETASVTSSTPVEEESIQGQMVPATNRPAAFNQARARTESEANTVQVVKDRQDGLVYISVTESSSGSEQAQLRQRLQEQFGLPELPGGNGARSGTGSGFFVSAAGDIITNNHVIEGASEITIRLHGNKKTYKAKVIARAPDFDLALIRAEGVPREDIQALPLGDSSRLDVGLKAIAMGAPFGLDFSVSEGIISSLERTVPVGTKQVNQQVIQTDAAINPGNSGGPLLNSAGEVIGVNTQILTGGIGQSAGVGFAIPINTVKKLLPQLQAGKGGVIRTPTLGIQFTDLSALSDEERKAYNLPASGALLQQVYPNSPAARAGLKGGSEAATVSDTGGGSAQIATDGDIITAVDGQAITEGDDLRRAVIGKQIGDRLTLTVRRGSKTREVTVQLQAFDFPQASGQE
ncbi:trypsin-like peptidase domain-containing protein [Deinococcus deserti]|uniref:Putative trypsin-like serine protease n=1 Tax=Deinococcus deserti (strain DSM 17065 / CIP 109153 / LMG 22923 / VCD115) TaxID=546414 RepID=C1CUR5_DEIDV|nr:trypsin-like peptidase domain-containing protein [Deinococcus deserti]ACO45932.1 putative trypsin-like serine protease, precursor [Deinococcus deserti VCD115]